MFNPKMRFLNDDGTLRDATKEDLGYLEKLQEILDDLGPEILPCGHHWEDCNC